MIMAEKKIKLVDLLKGTGMEEIPKKWFNPETGDSEKGGRKSIDMVLPVDEDVILKAHSEQGEADKGVVIKCTKKGIYEVQYWYETPDNIVPISLKADGTSKGKAVKKVTLEYNPNED
tara:strand:- start:380 stop:733 length:354 start_codon:yes stop_codon:yes gene_type:complete